MLLQVHKLQRQSVNSRAETVSFIYHLSQFLSKVLPASQMRIYSGFFSHQINIFIYFGQLVETKQSNLNNLITLASGKLSVFSDIL